jgi:acyl-CoA synthetase (AMP-forming)/AMP-acid ligase II
VDDAALTYRALDEASARVAGLLHERGLKPGDRVGIMMPNVAEVPVAYYGVLRAGGVVVPMNPLLKAREVAYYLGDSGAGLMFAWHAFADQARGGAEQAEADVIVVDGVAFPDLLASAAPDDRVAERDDEDTAVILYTSGTTGHPKGAELTHGNLISNTDAHRHRPGRPGRCHLRRASAVPRVRADGRAQRRGGLWGVPDPAAAVRRRACPADHRRPPGHRLRGRADHVRGPAARP